MNVEEHQQQVYCCGQSHQSFVVTWLTQNSRTLIRLRHQNERLASHKYWHTATPSPPRPSPDVTVWSNMKMLMLTWYDTWCTNVKMVRRCESVVLTANIYSWHFKHNSNDVIWGCRSDLMHLPPELRKAFCTTFFHAVLPKTDRQTLMCNISYSFLLRGVFRGPWGNSDKPLFDQQS